MERWISRPHVVSLAEASRRQTSCQALGTHLGRRRRPGVLWQGVGYDPGHGGARDGGIEFSSWREGASHAGTADVGPEVVCSPGAVGAWARDPRAGVPWPAWDSGLVLGDGDSSCARRGSVHTSVFAFTGVREIPRKAVLWRDHYVVLVARQTTEVWWAML